MMMSSRESEREAHSNAPPLSHIIGHNKPLAAAACMCVLAGWLMCAACSHKH